MLMQNSDTSQGIFVLSCSVSVEITHWVSNILSRKPRNMFIFLFKASSYSFIYMWCKSVVMKIIFRKWWKMLWLNCSILPMGGKRKTNIFLFFSLSVLACNRMWYQKTCKVSRPSETFVVCCKPFGYFTGYFILGIILN